MRIICCLFLFISVNFFSQKKIVEIDSVSGVIFETHTYSKQKTIDIAKDFEYILKSEFGKKYNGFVRQYSLFRSYKDRKLKLFILFIPIEKSYDYKWRYKKIDYFYDDVLYTFYDFNNLIYNRIRPLPINE